MMAVDAHMKARASAEANYPLKPLAGTALHRLTCHGRHARTADESSSR